MTRLVICPAARIMAGASLIYLGSKYKCVDNDGVKPPHFQFIHSHGESSFGSFKWWWTSIHAPPKSEELATFFLRKKINTNKTRSDGLWWLNISEMIRDGLFSIRIRKFELKSHQNQKNYFYFIYYIYIPCTTQIS